MDLMAIRRMLMSMGGNVVIGEFSQYSKFNALPTSGDYLNFTNPFAVVPKLIRITCPSGSGATQPTYIQRGIFDFDKFGVLLYTTSGGADRLEGMLRNDTPTIAGRFGVYNGNIQIYRNSSGTYNTSTEYIIECYA